MRSRDTSMTDVRANTLEIKLRIEEIWRRQHANMRPFALFSYPRKRKMDHRDEGIEESRDSSTTNYVLGYTTSRLD